MSPRLLLLSLVLPAALGASAHGALTPSPATQPAEPDPAQLAFFEKSIRPVLASKCYKCHSAQEDKAKGGLMLDTREGIRRGGDSGHAVVPGNVKESLLLKALHWTDKDLRMPPEKDGGKLSDDVIADFQKWIAMGAPDPRVGVAVLTKKEIDWEKARQFWAFQSPKTAPAPAVKDAAWPRTDVDRFILAAQEEKGLHPVADADKNSLLRRVYFDLVGLPPSPEETKDFLNDSSPDAFAKVVDQLLASPRFGERWGRHWMDVARYAESTGKERNFTYPTAWRYRDYVIDAVNADRPYNEFLREQIAGDLLPAKSEAERQQHLVATGFLAIGAKSLQEKNGEQFKMDLIDEQIDTTTRAVLGLTVACARCHDHKFDPVPQKDYYALAGIFRSTETLYGVSGSKVVRNNSTLIPLVPEEKTGPAPAPKVEAAPAPAPEESLTAQQRQRLSKLEKRDPAMAAQFKADLARRAEKNKPVETKPAAITLSPEQQQRLAMLEKRDPKRAAEIKARLAQGEIPGRPAPAIAQAGNKKRAGKQAARSTSTPADGTALCMGAHDGRPVQSRLLTRGEVSAPGDSIPRGFVTVLARGEDPKIPEDSSGRTELAAWLTSEQNPLTARVAVNRIWLHLFGQGLVRTADNFGATGERPSHPELLDNLAVQFMHDGWSVKKMIRSLVLSRTYQLANVPDAKGDAADPDNRLLWQASQRRLDAEAIRDAILASSGEIDLQRPSGSAVAIVGDTYIGKAVKPERFTEIQASYRSVYLPIVRDFTPEVLELFDFAEPSLVVASRDATNVPSQALYLMNNTFVRAQAQALAKKILAAHSVDEVRIAEAYQRTLGRMPTDAEYARATSYLRDTALALAGKGPELPWASFCQALFACAEFRYVR